MPSVGGLDLELGLHRIPGITTGAGGQVTGKTIGALDQDVAHAVAGYPVEHERHDALPRTGSCPTGWSYSPTSKTCVETVCR
jgi:hypothetical protein